MAHAGMVSRKVPVFNNSASSVFKHRTLRASSSCGSFEEDLFFDRISKIVTAHNTSQPLFLVYAARMVHYPLQVRFGCVLFLCGVVWCGVGAWVSVGECWVGG
jgi:hypothetical protein